MCMWFGSNPQINFYYSFLYELNQPQILSKCKGGGYLDYFALKYYQSVLIVGTLLTWSVFRGFLKGGGHIFSEFAFL